MGTKDFDFSGYVTKYNVVCSDGRTIAPEAFKDCDGKVLPLTDCTGLQTTDNVIGHITLQHRSDGVYGYGQFNNSPLARAYKMIVKNHVATKLGIYANKIKETDKIVTFGVIRSVSICFNGANPEAYIDSALETGEVYMTGEDYNLYMEVYKYAKKDFEPKQGEWIPVSERLPEEHGYYLVTTDGSHTAVIDIAEYGKFFRKPENEYVLEWNKASRVIAWQPLPEPYKKGGAE